MAYSDAFIAWVRKEAEKIQSDGCSCVPDFYKDCCLIHDLSYYYAKSPYSAYEQYRTLTPPENEHCWHYAAAITQKDADGYLKACIRARSKLGKWSPMALWRYWALREFGAKAWHSHDNTHNQ